MFKKVLIANRGEIAIRIIRALREMGIQSVAVYSAADGNSLHVHLADEAVCIGPGPANESYLNMQNVLSAALITGADAIHPGFGFLSENSKFAKIVTDCGIKFIGPSWEVIEKMGDKAKAREIAKSSNVPVIPGVDGCLRDLDHAKEMAQKIGFPLMLKAVNGGGGRGIRVIKSMEELEANYPIAFNEAKACFGDGSLYMEKQITKARHIEFQILADEHGNCIHLGERDCSLQRRNQKVMEEAPSVGISKELRDKMGEAAVRAAKGAGYTNAGTIEFLLEPDNQFYFMEMNTRIQVEHPVTEMVTGFDLIKDQICIAAGENMHYQQKQVEIRGHAIECRICAEDAKKNFMPSCERVSMLHIPGGNGVRFDGCLYYGYNVSPFYDSMLGKLIVHGKDRQEAIAKMKSAITEMIVEGPETNIDFQLEILNHEDYEKGEFNTHFIEEKMVIE